MVPSLSELITSLTSHWPLVLHSSQPYDTNHILSLMGGWGKIYNWLQILNNMEAMQLLCFLDWVVLYKIWGYLHEGFCFQTSFTSTWSFNHHILRGEKKSYNGTDLQFSDLMFEAYLSKYYMYICTHPHPPTHTYMYLFCFLYPDT